MDWGGGAGLLQEASARARTAKLRRLPRRLAVTRSASIEQTPLAAPARTWLGSGRHPSVKPRRQCADATIGLLIKREAQKRASLIDLCRALSRRVRNHVIGQPARETVDRIMKNFHLIRRSL